MNVLRNEIEAVILIIVRLQTDIQRSLPSGNLVSVLQGSSVISSLRQQVDEVQSIKEGRVEIEVQLKDVECEIGKENIPRIVYWFDYNSVIFPKEDETILSCLVVELCLNRS